MQLAERLERIPWIAPEYIDSAVPIGNTGDQWSFGVTLLEICNNGEVPMSGCDLSKVGHKLHLLFPHHSEL